MMSMILQDFNEYDKWIENWLLRNGSAVQEVGFLLDFELALGRWHRSKDKKSTPYTNFPSFMMNKKWWLEEQFNLHMMRFQQVKYMLIEQLMIQ